MAHTNYRRKNKQNHHGYPSWYGKPNKYNRKNKRRTIRRRDVRLIHHQRYDEIFESKKDIDEYWD